MNRYRLNVDGRMPALLATIMLLSLIGSASAAGARFSLVGQPTPLITDQDRVMLGLKFGPDAPIDFFQAKNGQYYLNSAGSLGPVQGPGRMAAWNVHVDSQLTRILALNADAPARGPDDVQTIMTDHAADCGRGRQRLRADTPDGMACTQYFDRDYAGGGTYYRCPDGGTSVYFYHGENHTTPDGTGGQGGWFGLGVGIFNAAETQVTRAAELPAAGGRTSAQIIGMNMSTQWLNAGGSYTPPQEHPFNGVPSVVPGTDGYLYLYTGNATLNPEYNPWACRPGCLSVSRAPVAAFCGSIKSSSPVHWANYYHGSWTQPAVLGDRSPDGYGSGGAFTPLIAQALPGEFGGTVTYLPSARLYAMARLYNGGVDVRYSADGLNWSGPQMLVERPREMTPNGDAELALYPKISVIRAPGGAERYVLTYVIVTKGHFWKWAELMRQSLSLQ